VALWEASPRGHRRPPVSFLNAENRHRPRRAADAGGLQPGAWVRPPLAEKCTSSPSTTDGLCRRRLPTPCAGNWPSRSDLAGRRTETVTLIRNIPIIPFTLIFAPHWSTRVMVFLLPCSGRAGLCYAPAAFASRNSAAVDTRLLALRTVLHQPAENDRGPTSFSAVRVPLAAVAQAGRAGPNCGRVFRAMCSLTL
jgi:hypothetical protein